jgi:SAM-dependent methyltransferase
MWSKGARLSSTAGREEVTMISLTGRHAYSSTFYKLLRECSELSAAEMVPLIVGWFNPKTMVDVGCGTGAFTRAYKTAGVQVLGIDNDVDSKQLLINPEEFQRCDLLWPLGLDRRFDLVNCLEVAEHLPPSRGPSFISDLCRLADVVVFSAAVPGQGGTHHVNEQWPSYWIAHFEKNGFQAFDCIRPQIWQNRKIDWWYVQNTFVFIKRSRMADFPIATEMTRSGPTDLVHPRAYVETTLPREMSPRMVQEVLRALPFFPGKIFQLMRGRTYRRVESRK